MIQGRTCLMVLGAVLSAAACGKSAPLPENDPDLASHGSIEVTARLEEIRGEFIDRPMYDYAFVMKYKVLETHRGEVAGDTIYIGHYNPLKPRDSVADARVPDIGGNVEQFRVGDAHRMALEVPIEDNYMGGIVNRYFDESVGPVYWAVWTNQAKSP